jgi:hypothetical protein
LPSVPGDRLASGLSDEAVPAEYAGGLGAAGLDAIGAFVRAGGTLVCLGQSGPLAIGAFDLPVRDVARQNDRLFVPGSILRLELDPANPIAFGMPPDTSAFYAFSSVFAAASASGPSAPYQDPSPAAGIQTVGRYGKQDVLISGWLEGEGFIAGRAAILEASIGAGRVVLFGFPVQHRGQSHATFRLLFNAIFSATPAPARNTSTR